MDIKKVLNNGQFVERKIIYNFLTIHGTRTPKEIWVGTDNFNTQLADTTRKGVISKINRNNRVFITHPELLNI